MPKFPDALYDPTPPDPLALVAPFLPRPPQTVVIGGLGDGNEGACARRRWSGCKLLGIDFDPRAIHYQINRGWGHPSDGTLVQKALSDRPGSQLAAMDELNCASLHQTLLDVTDTADLLLVECTTLDQLEHDTFPWNDCLLWLDLEGYESRALQGARRLLASGRVLLLNVETRYLHEPENRALNHQLSEAGYARAWVWFRQWWGHNEVWVRKAEYPDA